jgi:hypothetical protein
MSSVNVLRWTAVCLAAAAATAGAPAQQVFSTLTPPVPGPTTVTTVPSAASNWKPIGSTGPGCVQHWDPSTAASRGAVRQAWFMVSCQDRPEQSVKVLVYVRCGARTLATAQTLAYAGMFGSGDPGPAQQRTVRPADFAPPAPGSTDADWIQLVCRTPAAKRR